MASLDYFETGGTLCRRTLLVIEGNVFLSEGLAGH